MIDPLLGAVLAERYEILERIGDGGIGAVYRARRVADDVEVAVKVLSEQLARDPTWVKRFENEALAAAQLEHPNTVRVFDWGQSARDGRLYIAMELLKGRSLRQELAFGLVEPARALGILAQACLSLAEAHGRGIVHRDLKPDNLYLLGDRGGADRVKLLDFSVAKLRQQAGTGLQTAAGVVFGTPQYMAPEQGRGFPVDARSDVYSLGVLAFEMVTGRVPFNAKDPMEVLAAQVREPVPPLPGVPEPVAAIIRRCLAKDPAQRYPTAMALHDACRTFLAPPPPPRATVERGPSLTYWIVCLACGVGAGVLGYVLLGLIVDRL